MTTLSTCYCELHAVLCLSHLTYALHAFHPSEVFLAVWTQITFAENLTNDDIQWYISFLHIIHLLGIEQKYLYMDAKRFELS